MRRSNSPAAGSTASTTVIADVEWQPGLRRRRRRPRLQQRADGLDVAEWRLYPRGSRASRSPTTLRCMALSTSAALQASRSSGPSAGRTLRSPASSTTTTRSAIGDEFLNADDKVTAKSIEVTGGSSLYIYGAINGAVGGTGGSSLVDVSGAAGFGTAGALTGNIGLRGTRPSSSPPAGSRPSGRPRPREV